MNETEAKPDSEVSEDEHRSLMTNKIMCVLLGVVFAAVLLPPTVSTALRRWPKLCCRYGDINIKTGQARYARYVGFVKISDEVKDTPVSLVLEGKNIDVADIEPWHRVYTSSPGVISAHYRYHKALSQARQIDVIAELTELGPKDKRLIAENVLKLWQTERSYFPVTEYLQTAFEERIRKPEQDRSKEYE